MSKYNRKTSEYTENTPAPKRPETVKIEVNFGWSGDHLQDLYFSEMYDHIETMKLKHEIKKHPDHYWYVVAECSQEQYRQLCELAEMLGCIVYRVKR